ncbi:MAG TPA: M28 family peptidase [Flavobacteriales bacterium]|nr:M28 family peptidase [Flavobacteriales bacterium]
MRKVLVVLGLVALLPVHAQVPADPVVVRARAIIETLTLPSMHGRGYVNAGDSLAAEYIAAQFRAVGLQPYKDSWFEPFHFKVNSFPGAMDVALDGKALKPGIDFLVDPVSGSAKGRYDVVNLTLDDLLTPERKAMTMGVITGRAIAFAQPETDDPDTLALCRQLERELMYYGPVLKRARGKLTWSVANEALPNPLIELVPEVWHDSLAVLDINVEHKLIARYQTRNVWGFAKGKSSKRLLVVTAHYDHLGRMGRDTYFPGANDNASGVSMLINLAAHFAKNKAPYDVLFIAFAGEEAGLQGSEWCAVDRPMDLGSIRMLINLDLLGTGDDGIMVVNATKEEALYNELVEMNQETGRLVAVKKRGPACNSDHCPFVKRGVPGVFIYTLGGITAYHDVLDRAETLPLTDYKDVYLTLVDLIGTLK